MPELNQTIRDTVTVIDTPTDANIGTLAISFAVLDMEINRTGMSERQRQRITRLEGELAATKQEVRNLEAENKNIRIVNAAAKAELEETCAMLEDEIKQLRTDNTKLHTEIAELRVENKIRREEIADLRVKNGHLHADVAAWQARAEAKDYLFRYRQAINDVQLRIIRHAANWSERQLRKEGITNFQDFKEYIDSQETTRANALRQAFDEAKTHYGMTQAVTDACNKIRKVANFEAHPDDSFDPDIIDEMRERIDTIFPITHKKITADRNDASLFCDFLASLPK